MIALGDHEPARFVAGVDGFDVPIHLIGPPDLVEAFDHWGWTDGLVPDGDVDPWTMDAFCDRFLRAIDGGPSRDETCCFGGVDRVRVRGARARPIACAGRITNIGRLPC